MKKIKVLNAYCGIGGNRKLWKNVEVTAIEIDPSIAKIYQDFFPEDKVIVTDAHKYLLEHYKEFDFIWSSPPCPSHSHVRFELGVLTKVNKPIYPDMKLYEEIILLKHHFKGKWVVENVVSYYEPLIRPFKSGRHYFWSNFHISNIKIKAKKLRISKIRELEKFNGVDLSKYQKIDKRTILRNCVDTKLGLHVFNCAFKEIQKTF